MLVQVVFTAFTRALVKGEKGQRDMERIQIDTATFFTVLPSEVLFEIRAYLEGLKNKGSNFKREIPWKPKSIRSSSLLRDEKI